MQYEGFNVLTTLLLTELADYKVTQLYDVGVAGIHRLLRNQHVLRASDVAICVAGMDGALPGVVVRMALVCLQHSSSVFLLTQFVLLTGRSHIFTSDRSPYERWLRSGVRRPSSIAHNAQRVLAWSGCRQHRQWLRCRRPRRYASITFANFGDHLLQHVPNANCPPLSSSAHPAAAPLTLTGYRS